MSQPRFGTARRYLNGTLHPGEYNNATGEPIGARDPSNSVTKNVHVGSQGWDDFFHPSQVAQAPAPVTRPQQPPTQPAATPQTTAAPIPPRPSASAHGIFPPPPLPNDKPSPQSKTQTALAQREIVGAASNPLFPALGAVNAAGAALATAPKTIAANLHNKTITQPEAVSEMEAHNGAIQSLRPPTVLQDSAQQNGTARFNANSNPATRNLPAQPQQQQQAPWQPTVNGTPVEHDGAGWFAMTPNARGQQVKTYVTPSAHEAMDMETKGQWGNWNQQQRGAYLRSRGTGGRQVGEVTKMDGYDERGNLVPDMLTAGSTAPNGTVHTNGMVGYDPSKDSAMAGTVRTATGNSVGISPLYWSPEQKAAATQGQSVTGSSTFAASPKATVATPPVTSHPNGASPAIAHNDINNGGLAYAFPTPPPSPNVAHNDNPSAVNAPATAPQTQPMKPAVNAAGRPTYSGGAPTADSKEGLGDVAKGYAKSLGFDKPIPTPNTLYGEPIETEEDRSRSRPAFSY